MSADSSHKPENAMSLVLWKGFTNELAKIADASPLSNVKQMVATQKGALSTKKPNWSKTPKPVPPLAAPSVVGNLPPVASPPPATA